VSAAVPFTGPVIQIVEVGHKRFRIGSHEGAVRGAAGLVSQVHALHTAQSNALRGRRTEFVTMLPDFSAREDGREVVVSLVTGEVSAELGQQVVEPTTHDRLAALGLTHRTPEARVYYSGTREILNAAGEVVFTGNVREVNDWLEDLEAERGAP